MNIQDFEPLPTNPEQRKQMQAATDDYKELATAILAAVPSSAHRTAALRLLLESKMTLIHGITHPPA